ncbi:MAG TPA: GNAT family N-acetyltransferase [Rhizomicrobium sp.]|jgi:RimJ/RimL family protein N-acetyltransferase|nr:GNAT family N-acetyltransferase [Rhizomicrobium sp.]
MITLHPVTLERDGIRLEPLAPAHKPEVAEAVTDGELWKLWFTSVPEPQGVAAWLETALAGQERGVMLPWAVRELASGKVIGSTRYHDILPELDRVEIGYTWYRASRQRSKVNTLCKLMLMTHAFETLGCGVVGLRTDNFNFRSQAAIEALGAKKDGVIRNYRRRRDGSIGDTVMYSILSQEWPAVKRHLELRLERHRPG